MFSGPYYLLNEDASVASQCPHSVLNTFVVTFYVVLAYNGLLCKAVAEVYLKSTLPPAVIAYEDLRRATGAINLDPLVRAGAAADTLDMMLQIAVLCGMAVFAAAVGYGNVVCPAQMGTPLYVWSRYAGACDAIIPIAVA